MNIGCRSKESYRLLWIQKTKRSDSTLRNSAVRYSIFCGSLFAPGQANEAVDLIHMKTSDCEASYKVSVVKKREPA
jgi:hypothetical protein